LSFFCSGGNAVNSVGITCPAAGHLILRFYFRTAAIRDGALNQATAMPVSAGGKIESTITFVWREK
jgi:hypothetical protein